MEGVPEEGRDDRIYYHLIFNKAKSNYCSIHSYQCTFHHSFCFIFNIDVI